MDEWTHIVIMVHTCGPCNKVKIRMAVFNCLYMYVDFIHKLNFLKIPMV